MVVRCGESLRICLASRAVKGPVPGADPDAIEIGTGATLLGMQERRLHLDGRALRTVSALTICFELWLVGMGSDLCNEGAWFVMPARL